MCMDFFLKISTHIKQVYPNRVRMRVTDMPSVVDPVCEVRMGFGIGPYTIGYIGSNSETSHNTRSGKL